MRLTMTLQKQLLTVMLLALAWLATLPHAWAQADLEINTPAIAALESSMQQRHTKLAAYYASGAIGLTQNGLITIRDASSVPLAQRPALNNLVADENRDRGALYKEIARANGHPGGGDDIRAKFAERWVAKASPGWWYQNAGGGWTQK